MNSQRVVFAVTGIDRHHMLLGGIRHGGTTRGAR
jgi:hypothetical protein